MDIMDKLNIGKASPSKKRKKKNDDDEGGVDRISQLPDEVIVHMLSFLSLKTAAATSVLSPRWLQLWKHLPNLKFEFHELGPYNQVFHMVKKQLDSLERYERSLLCMRKYIDWVNSVIELYNKSHSFSLQEFSIVALVDKPNQHQVTKWLEFACSRRVETLKLISNIYWSNAGVLTDMLKDMSIVPRSSGGFKSLKVLWLKSFNMSSEAIEILLQSCPMLERLVLDMLSVTTDLEVGGSIKHLDMRCTRYETKLVKICAPNLTWLTVDHYTNKVSLENVPKLVNMTFYCYSSFMDTMHDFAQVAAQLETLVIFLFDPIVGFSVPEMPNLKKLVVYYRFQGAGVLLPVTCFMRAAPALEDFKIDVGELGVERKVLRIPKDGHEHRHLRRFVLSGFCGGSWDRIELVRYVVNYCVALEEIVIGQCNREELVRDFVDYCVPLHHIIPRPNPGHKDYVATPQERQDINKLVRLFTPPRIKLRVV